MHHHISILCDGLTVLIKLWLCTLHGNGRSSHGCYGPLQWHHNGRDGASNHQPYDWLLNRLYRRRSKKTTKLRVTGFCEGNSPVTGGFPAQRASNAEHVSIWWHHHVINIDEESTERIILLLAMNTSCLLIHVEIWFPKIDPHLSCTLNLIINYSANEINRWCVCKLRVVCLVQVEAWLTQVIMYSSLSLIFNA